MNKYFTSNNVIIVSLILGLLLCMFIMNRQVNHINKVTNELVELKQRHVDVNDAYSSIEHELNNISSMVGDFTVFEYNEKLEHLCLEQGYEYHVDAFYRNTEDENEQMLIKLITIKGDGHEY